MAGWVVAVEGASASGKSRTVALARRTFGATALREAVDRLSPPPSFTWTSHVQLLRLERRLLAEDARRYREALRARANGDTVLADTGFLGPLTYTLGLVRSGTVPESVLSGLLTTARAWARAGRWGLPDAILYLRTPLAERQRRAEGDPRGHPTLLQRRHQSIAAEELRFYRRVVAPAFGPRFRFVSGLGAPEEVVARVARAVEATRAPSPRPTVAPLLRALDHPKGVP
ncbi:MAG: hypothetical protein L3K10_07235 [Thermoplasmata archaeon]|nr:hypothetical protein [Thermoplasmata archaeon]